MKAVFFDTDRITKQYMEGKNIEGVDITFMEESLSTISGIDMSSIEDADIISVFVHSTSVTESLLSRFPNLKMVSTRSTGYNNIDLDYCRKKGIEVCNTPAYGGTTVAEFTFGLILDVVKNITRSSRDFKEREPDIASYMSLDLQGKTLGIIGTGAIGRHVIKLATAFGMNILAYDPYPSDEVKNNPSASYVSFEDLLKGSDIITLHAPATKENYHLISEEAISTMKKGVYIINTARGDLIDTSALYRGLIVKKVAGAGLDVIEYENFFIQDDAYTQKPQDFHKDEMFKSLINMKLMQQDNVIITPHIAFNSIDAIHRILNITLDNIDNFNKGKVINSVL